jgi:hypothetical protein
VRAAVARGAGITADLIKGAVAGAAAWWVMDQVLMFLYDHEKPAVRRRETRARRGIPALEVLAERGATSTGTDLTGRQRAKAGIALQWIIGAGLGALYGVVRGSFPGPRVVRGIGYGAAASLLIDEGLIPLLGFAPGPAAFPWQTHARGFVGHLVFGGVADVTVDLLDRALGDPS